VESGRDRGGSAGGDGAGDADGFAGLPRFVDHPMLRDQVRVVLRNCGIIDPEEVDHYLARGGYRALESCLGTSAEAVIDTVKASGLRGRGGGGFPTCRSGSSAARQRTSSAT